MINWTVTYFQNYYPLGDVLVIILSVIFVLLLTESVVNNSRGFKIFVCLIIMLIAAAVSNLCFNVLFVIRSSVPAFLIYGCRLIYRLMLYGVLYGYVYYALEALYLDKVTRRHYLLTADIAFLVSACLETVILISGRGLSFDNYRATEGLNLFIVTYVFFVGFIAYLLIRYRARVIRQILKSIFLIFGVCIVVFLVQGVHRQTSYTTFIFLIPIIAILYLMHSNPYDQATGAVNEASFNYLIKRIASSRSEYVVMSLLLFGFEHEGSFTDEMRLAVYQFGAGIAKNAQMFKAMGGHLLFVFPREKNPDYKTVVETLRLQFDRLHSYFHITFKAVFLLTNDSLNAHNEYSSFISFIEERMPMNTYYWVNEEDLSHFEKRRYIISQLEDISRKKDLDDERVLVYCQPVYNVETGRYDTAEALMRLTLKDFGMVNPDQFIPVAEEETLIHSLSLIILNKTCKAIAELQGEGYLINRISINFSMLEVREDNFCSDMIKIIQDNEISPEKIAIELTESRNLEDFEMVKKKIGELKDYGIKFYLDDFGTGYSNFERIMEIPFDIIKFDRSLVIEASKNEHSAYMVSTFADMFCKLKYHVLYEGVENESDEKRCIKMQAQYLQGFKYSRPIPIGMLRNFLIQQK